MMKKLDPKSRKFLNEYEVLERKYEKNRKKRKQLLMELKNQGFLYRELAHYFKRSERRLKQLIAKERQKKK